MGEPMRTRRTRPPGFSGPSPEAPPAGPPAATGARARTHPRVTISYRDAPVRQLNVRLAEPLHARYRQLLRDLEDAGTPSSWTELVHALLWAGPGDAAEAAELVRVWRRQR